MSKNAKDRKLYRREFLQAVAVGSAAVPALELGMSRLALATNSSFPAHASDTESGKATDDQSVISIESKNLRVSFDKQSGALVSLESKLTGWRIQNRRELAQSFVMFVPLPERHFHRVLGGQNPPASTRS